MPRKDREQAKDRGNADVVRDERGRGADAGRGPYERHAGDDKAEGSRGAVNDQPGAEGGDDVGREQRLSVGERNPSSTGGRKASSSKRGKDDEDLGAEGPAEEIR